ncbi:MAG: S8 family peptidase [Vitreoscilla sp.]|nr:S8 family peptidase [Vitreoscilla sp.]
MSQHISRQWALPAIAALLALAMPLTSMAGTRSGKASKETVPELSTRLIIRLGEGNLDAPLLAKVRAVAAKQGLNLTHLRKLARGGDVLDLGKALPPETLHKLAAALTKLDSRIDYVEPDTVMVPMTLSDDKHVGVQWNLTETAGGIRLAGAWARTRGQGVVVAVVDGGVRPHVDLADNLLPGYDFISNRTAARDGDGRDANASDEGNWYTRGQCTSDQLGAEDSSWHGTHVAGTVAALANNGIGVAGVAPGAKVLPVRVLGRCGGYTSDIIDGILWAAGVAVDGVPANPTPARVINLSLGSLAACGKSMQLAVNAARDQGAVLVAAAGNSAIDVKKFSPAGCAGVISVGATTRSGAQASYSNFGTGITVSAPGGDMRAQAVDGVLSTLNSGTKRPATDVLAYMQGTSMAAPHVSGVVALMLARNPQLSVNRVEDLLRASARPLPGACRGGCGAGIVDAAAAVTAAGTALLLSDN